MSVDVSYDDPYVGKVYANVVDFYHNPSYNIKLFMVRKGISDRLTEENIFNTPELQGPTGPVQRSDIVVLAQTGVTGNQLDDLTIQSLVGVDTPQQLKYEFTITQPGAANFLDQIIATKNYLGYEPIAGITAYLEFRWQGYRDATIEGASNEDENDDTDGQPEIIAGPLRYKIHINRISVKIDSTGSTYQCVATRFGDRGFRDPIFRMPQDFATKGSTVTEHIKDLEDKLNEWHRDNTKYDVKDVIEFDLQYLIKTENAGDNLATISDDSLDTENIEEVNRLMNEGWTAETADELRDIRIQNAETTGTNAEVQQKEIALNVKTGMTIDQYLMALLSMCPEVYSKITRLEDIENRNSKVKAGQGFVSWFKTTADTYEIEFDRKRNDYAYRYVFTPRIYKTARVDRGKTKEENEPNQEEKRSRLQQYKDNGSLLKAYNYIFTGLNDQILSLDIQYNNGIALITSPNDGNIGEYSISEGVLASPNVPQNISPRDTGAEAVVEEVKREDAQRGLLGLFDVLRDAGGAARDQFANQLADFTGRSLTEIAGLINDATGAAAEAFLNELDSQTIRQLAADTNVLPTNTAPTESVEVIGGPGGDFQPEFSGFVYSEDLVNFNDPRAVDQNIDPQILVERGFVVSQQTGEPTDTKQLVENAQDRPSETEEAGATLASTRTKLFGMLTSQTLNDNFLMKLEMDLRGDPWYMGAPNLDGRSTTDRANFRGDDNLFWLRLAAPTVYDPDWSDEDSEINSGYWNYNGTSYTFTGVYRMNRVTNVFSKGQYTVQMVADRLINLEPQDRNPPELTDPNDPETP